MQSRQSVTAREEALESSQLQLGRRRAAQAQVPPVPKNTKYRCNTQIQFNWCILCNTQDTPKNTSTEYRFKCKPAFWQLRSVWSVPRSSGVLPCSSAPSFPSSPYDRPRCNVGSPLPFYRPDPGIDLWLESRNRNLEYT